jgi:hypothetical protein
MPEHRNHVLEDGPFQRHGRRHRLEAQVVDDQDLLRLPSEQLGEQLDALQSVMNLPGEDLRPDRSELPPKQSGSTTAHDRARS